MGANPKDAVENKSSSQIRSPAGEQLRQDRFEVTGEDCSLVVGTRKLEVVNYSTFGLAVALPANDAFSDELVNGRLLCNEVEISALQLRKVRESIDAARAVRILAFEVLGQPISIERIRTVIETTQILDDAAYIQQANSQIPTGFRFKVYEVKQYLENLSQSIADLRTNKKFESNHEIDEFEKAVVDLTANHLFKTFLPVYAGLANELSSADRPAIKASYEFFRAQLRSLICASPFADRSLNKPLGYAGDFEVMNIIYRSENIGSNLFGKCLHKFFVEHPETKAVKNRVNYLTEKIAELINTKDPSQPLRILSVASGPAMELQHLIKNWKGRSLENVEFHLLDQDVFSLKHAQRQLREAALSYGKSVPIRYFNKSIKHVIVGGLPESNYDLVYSAGLFDYFSDAVAQAAAQKIFSGLKQGGSLVIGNFNVTTPNKFFMEAALDWNLIFRSEDDLKRLFEGVSPSLVIESEPESVNLFCVMKK